MFLQYYKMSNYTKDLWSWSTGSLCKVVQRSFTRSFLCCCYWNIVTCLIVKYSAVIADINVASICKPSNWQKSAFYPWISQNVQTLWNLLLGLLHKNAFSTITAYWLDQGPVHYVWQVGYLLNIFTHDLRSVTIRHLWERH